MTFSDFVNRWIFQMAHIFFSAYLVETLAAVMNPFLALGIGVGFAAVKEGIFDPLTESGVLAGNGWEDFAFLSAGCLIGFVTHFLVK